MSSTHALRGRLSRRSEIASMGDWLGWVGATSSLGLSCESCRGFADFFVLGTAAYLGPMVNFGADLQSCLSCGCGFSPMIFSDWAGSGVGGGIVALKTRPPRTTWFQSSSSLSCSAHSSSHFAFGAVGWMGLTSALLRSVGARFASAALASFHFTQPRLLAVWFPPQLQHLSCCCEVEHSLER